MTSILVLDIKVNHDPTRGWTAWITTTDRLTGVATEDYHKTAMELLDGIVRTSKLMFVGFTIVVGEYKVESDLEYAKCLKPILQEKFKEWERPVSIYIN